MAITLKTARTFHPAKGLVLGLVSVAMASCAPSSNGAAPEAPAAPDAPQVAATDLQAQAAPRFQTSARPVAGSYIVQLANGTAPAAVEATADALLAQYGGTRTALYTHALQGFAARMPEAIARRLSEDARVHHVEQDAIATGAQVFGSGDTALGADVTGAMVGSGTPYQVDEVSNWSLDRIDQHAAPPLVGGVPQFTGQYKWQATGKGVRIYFLDSARNSDHYDFVSSPASRWLGYQDFVNTGGIYAQDCAGHGSAMASVAAGRISGVAKEASLFGVRILDCNNETNLTRLLQGTDWIAANVVKPAVVNLSISGPSSTSFNTAVANLVNVTGVLVVGAAGNGNTDACTTSPASEPTTLTVASANGYDQRSTFSNYGSCVDLNAPGTSTDAVTWSTRAISDRLRVTGTSVSTALVSGAAALYLQRYPQASPAEVRAALINNATSAVLDASTLSGSPNLLLYTGASTIPYAARNTSGQELGTNYVTNGGFESVSTGWTATGGSIGTGDADGLYDRPYQGSYRLGLRLPGTMTTASATTTLTGAQNASSNPGGSTFVVRYRLKINRSSLGGCPGSNGGSNTTPTVLNVSLTYGSGTVLQLAKYTECMVPDGSPQINALPNPTELFYSDGYREEWVDTGLTSLAGASAPVLKFDVAYQDTAPQYTASYGRFYIDNVRVVRADASTSGAWTTVLNPNFELGNNGNWTWTRDSGSAFVAGGGGANGSWSALLGNWSNNVAHTDTLRQNFAIPADSVEPRITIPVTMTTAETTTSVVDTLEIQVRDPSTSAVLATLGTFSNRSSASNTPTYALDRWIGQTIQLYFKGTSNANNLATSFRIDNITSARRTWTSPVLP